MSSTDALSYTVRYNISVDPSSANAAIEGFATRLTNFNKELASLNTAISGEITKLNTTVGEINAALAKIKPLNIESNLPQITAQLNEFAAAARSAAAASARVNRGIGVIGGSTAITSIAQNTPNHPKAPQSTNATQTSKTAAASVNTTKLSNDIAKQFKELGLRSAANKVYEKIGGTPSMPNNNAAFKNMTSAANSIIQGNVGKYHSFSNFLHDTYAPKALPKLEKWWQTFGPLFNSNPTVQKSISTMMDYYKAGGGRAMWPQFYEARNQILPYSNYLDQHFANLSKLKVGTPTPKPILPQHPLPPATENAIASRASKGIVSKMNGIFDKIQTRVTKAIGTSNTTRGSSQISGAQQTLSKMGGGMAVGLLKGMGIMYGIQGIGTLIGNIIRDSAEYDNTIQSAKNILKTHDKGANFDARFAEMEGVIRGVGVRTKFTAPQVAEAAKFLAMAGLNTNQIKESITPISNIALVGDSELGATADVVTNIMTSYGIPANRMNLAADVMTMTFTKTNTTLMEMAEAYKYAGAMLSTGNIGFEEASAAIGVLGDAGIKGSAAGTALRMILNNILNPTKKQLDEWKKIGVSRTDGHGRLRNLSDIFSDIHAKGLSADSYGRLFRITAAPAAAALAKNSEKWKEVIGLNFASGGVSSKLAEEKINTIQGLWAQITSAITEAGIKAFESEESAIKQMMRRAVAYFKDPQIVEKFKKLSQTVIGFIDKMSYATKKFIAIYEAFAPFIKLFISFQLIVWPITKAFGMLKAVLAGFTMVSGVTLKLNGLLAAMRGLGASSSTLTTKLGGLFVRPSIATQNGGSPMGTWWLNTLSGKNYSQEHWNKIGAKHPAYISRIGTGVASNMVNAGGMIGGALIGGELGSMFGEAGSVWGSMAGSVLMPILLGLGTGGLITAGAAAVAAIGHAWWDAYRASNAAKEALVGYKKELNIIGHLITGEGASEHAKYWDFVYGKHKKITDNVAERVRLLKEEMGIAAGGDDGNRGSYLDEGETSEYVKHMTQVGGSWVFGGFKRAKESMQYSGGHLSGESIFGLPRWDEYIIKANNWGRRDDNASALTYLYHAGTLASSKVVSELAGNALALAGSDKAEDFNNFLNKRNSFIEIKNYQKDTHPIEMAYGFDDVISWTRNQQANSYTFLQAISDGVKQAFPQDAINKIVAYGNAVQSGKLSEGVVLDFISAINNNYASLLNTYSAQNAEKWAANYGFRNGTFVGITDPKTGNVVASAAEAAQLVIKHFKPLQETLLKLPGAAQSAGSGLIGLLSVMLGSAQGFVWNDEHKNADTGRPPSLGTVETLNNGEKWKYFAGGWHKLDINGAPSIRGMLHKNFRAYANSLNGQSLIGNSAIVPSTVSPPKASKEDYKSNYNNNSAAPKQVIVNISNLMNVEKIDLSKKDNKEAISNLKSELAQCLVDAVSQYEEWTT